ncbi:MAG: PQQ-binding-like beta-propeller repeat protein [Planctomycetes bacterium]|nr:PQQ-binding-like beta-propeller repeat protein [Planctomycetota bacterium]
MWKPLVFVLLATLVFPRAVAAQQAVEEEEELLAEPTFLRQLNDARAPEESGDAVADPHLELLNEHGIEADAGSIGEYLRSLHPDEAERRRLSALIAQLGDEDFFRRESAMRALLKRPVHAPDLLDEAIAGDDAEIRWRAAQVKRIGERRSARLLFAVFETIREQGIEGLAGPVLRALPFCSDEYLRRAAGLALGETATPADADLFRRALNDSSPHVVVSAAGALEQLLGEEADDHLVPLFAHRDETVRLAAARAVANHGGRAALKVLADLLEADDLRVRSRSAHTLRFLTGQRFGFVGYEDRDRRHEMAAAWRDWIDKHAETAALKFPLEEAELILGRTLICYYNTGRIVELDAAGKEVWTQALGAPRGCDGLPNGHRVIASYTTRTIHEYDADGREIWQSNRLPGSPYSCRRLENGNTLVACYTTSEVLEIAPDKSVAWQVRLPSRPRDAHRLENGNTLVALYSSSKVIEVDRQGKVVWEIDNMNRPYAIQRLENGNTLVAQYGGRKVVEIDRQGKVTWEKDGLTYPYDAQRLPNGNTLIVDRNGVREFDARGEVVWERLGAGVARAERY